MLDFLKREHMRCKLLGISLYTQSPTGARVVVPLGIHRRRQYPLLCLPGHCCACFQQRDWGGSAEVRNPEPRTTLCWAAWPPGVCTNGHLAPARTVLWVASALGASADQQERGSPSSGCISLGHGSWYQGRTRSKGGQQNTIPYKSIIFHHVIFFSLFSYIIHFFSLASPFLPTCWKFKFLPNCVKFSLTGFINTVYILPLWISTALIAHSYLKNTPHSTLLRTTLSTYNPQNIWLRTNLSLDTALKIWVGTVLSTCKKAGWYQSTVF